MPSSLTGSDALDAPALYRASLRLASAPAQRRSLYLPMRDGVRIAVDLWLPRAGSGRLPTIVRQTRYFRSFNVEPALARVVGTERLDPVNAATRALFVASGYAWLDVDVRGSGASSGAQPYPWNPDEVRDGAEVVDWVVRQPWSSGKVGALGVSYDGTAAEMLLVNRHPAVRAVAPRFSLFDVYADVAFPGGLHLSWFTEHWGRANAALDRNEPGEFLGEVLLLTAQGRALGRGGVRGALGDLAAMALDQPRGRALLGRGVARLLGGVRPVDGHEGSLAEAVACHRDNFNVHEGALRIVYRDDAVTTPTHSVGSTDDFSPAHFLDALRGSGAAVFSQSGWFDGAYAASAVKRDRALGEGDHRLLLGPWSHGGQLTVSPFVDDHETRFDHAAELLRFFDLHLKGQRSGMEAEPRVRYFTMGAERWRSAPSFPPPEVAWQRLYFTRDLRLVPDRPAGSDGVEHRPDRHAGAGRRARWRGLLSPRVHTDGADRSFRAAELLSFSTAPLPRPLEVTGLPRLLLWLATSLPDGAVFAYLEMVDPAGRATLVTEGQLRMLHRRERDGVRTFLRQDAAAMVPGEAAALRFDLLPLSCLVPAGYSLRLCLACADEDHFTSPPGAPRWALRVGGEEGSWLELPVMP